MHEEIKKHFKDVNKRIDIQNKSKKLNDLTRDFMSESHLLKYSYNYKWLGRPIIQYPQDIVAFQEIIFEVKPNLIIETGIAHGGSLILSASLLSLLDIMEGVDTNQSLRKVIGVDIDIREHNYNAIKKHPLQNKIEMVEGSSIDLTIFNKVKDLAENYKNILVCLDSNHTHKHVTQELNLYSDLVTKDSYCIVYDTVIEDLPSICCNDRPWPVGDNPLTAVNEWLKLNKNFEVDDYYDKKSMISVAKGGFLKRIK